MDNYEKQNFPQSKVPSNFPYNGVINATKTTDDEVATGD